MHFSRQDISDLDKLTRINLINSITGIKPANLVGTASPEGDANLAIFSSVVHLGSNPPLIGFVLRPRDEVIRDTWQNIKQTNRYTINHVSRAMAERAHYTSAKFAPQVSEFERCGLVEEYLLDFPAPFVKESRIRMGMVLRDTVPIALNDTMLIIGEIEHIVVDDGALEKNGMCDLDGTDHVGVCGLNGYYSMQKVAEFPYARPDALPDFS